MGLAVDFCIRICGDWSWGLRPVAPFRHNKPVQFSLLSVHLSDLFWLFSYLRGVRNAVGEFSSSLRDLAPGSAAPPADLLHKDGTVFYRLYRGFVVQFL